MYQTVCCLLFSVCFLHGSTEHDQIFVTLRRLSIYFIADYKRYRSLNFQRSDYSKSVKHKTCGAFVLENHLWLTCVLYYFPWNWSLLSDSAVISSEPKLWVIITVFRHCSIYSICDPGAENQTQGSIFRNWDLYIINNLSFDVWCVMIENLESENHL